MGYRFRIHRKDLPGKPDIVLPRHQKVIFVHGCFWHGHGCKIGVAPKSNQAYWVPKITKNKERDAKAKQELETLGWKVLELWECEIRSAIGLEEKLSRFMTTDRHRF
jgi:DNA mismatch endonuclease, patch repair protein